LILLKDAGDEFVEAALEWKDPKSQYSTKDPLADDLAISDPEYPTARIEARMKNVWAEYDNNIQLEQLNAINKLASLMPRFRDNALQFLKKYPVVPYDGDCPDEGGDYDLITMDDSRQKPLILNMTLATSRGTFFSFGLGLGSKVSPSVPIYFLPWKSHRIVSLTIPAGTRGPNIFFTAGINGCSVFVDGPDTNPTIYHAGVTTPWRRPGNSVCQPVRTVSGNFTDGKPDNVVLLWRELFWNKSTNTARTIRRGNRDHPNYNFAEVNKTDYMNTPRVGPFQQTVERTWPKKYKIEACREWGCFFGIRVGTQWSFYLQENATIYFTDTKTKDQYRTSRVIQLTKKFPLAQQDDQTPPGNRNPQVIQLQNNTQAPTNLKAVNVFKLKKPKKKKKKR
jgi:hypothetical protein